MSKQTHEPVYRAFSVIEREGRDAFWQPLGAVFENSDNSLNLILQALPLPGPDGVCKIVLRRPKEEQQDDRTHDRDASRGGTSQRRR